MNLIQLKYALEVAATGSISKAAERLYVGQPGLSRAIKELESSLGVTIFDRSAKGMQLTPDGETFIRYAQSILKQVDALEDIFRHEPAEKVCFSLSAPRASYIADAFTRFSHRINNAAAAEVIYRETNAMRSIKNLLHEDYRLGIIRYADTYDQYYKTMLAEKELSFEVIIEFQHVLLMSRNSPLASREEITAEDLNNGIEIAHADPFVPSLPLSTVRKETLSEDIHRRIFVFERASEYELLANNTGAFMWVSPEPADILERYGLVQRPCAVNQRTYKDVLIRRRDYALSELDNLFINELCQSKRDAFGACR